MDFLNQDPIFIVLELIAVVILAGGIFLFIRTRKKNDEKAQAFLKGMIDDIQNILINVATSAAQGIVSHKFKSVEEFEKYVVTESSDKIWDMVSKRLTEAVTEGWIPAVVSAIITREYVDQFIEFIMRQLNIGSNVRAIYCENVVLLSSDDMIAADKEMSQKFDSKDYFEDEEEVDKADLRSEEFTDDTEIDIKLVGDNEVKKVEPKEIIPPQDDIDITQIEEVTEDVDGLTPEEIAAGIHFNKAGRKVDARGKFIKSK